MPDLGSGSLLGCRRIAVDLGSASIKVLLTEACGRGVRVLEHRTIDLRQEGLLSREEVSRHLQTVISDMGNHPVALAIPQLLSLAQIVDLPAQSGEDARKTIEAQTVSLAGLSESRVVFDYARLRAFGKFQNPCWVTIAREEDIQNQIARLGDAQAELCEISTPAAALIETCLATQPQCRDAVLVDLGARSTVVTIVQDGQGVFAASFPGGAETFSEAIVAEQKSSLPEAEELKRSHNVFTGEHRSQACCVAVTHWFAEVQKILHDWLAEHPGRKPALAQAPILLSGGALKQPGLLDFLKSKSPRELLVWPSLGEADRKLPLADYAVAYGLALIGAKRARQPISLLPQPLRAAQQRLRQMAMVNLVCLLLFAGLVALAGFATWQKLDLLQEKKDQVREANVALERVRQLEALARRRDEAYRQLWPLLSRQQQSLAVLKTLRALDHSQAQTNLWYVLLADRQSYSWGATLPPVTTNVPTLASTNGAPASSPRAELVAELCVPATGDATMKVLSEEVNTLKTDRLFRNVDSLPADERRNWVDPNALIPDRHFALVIELAGNLPPPSLLPSRRPERAATNEFRRGSSPAKPALAYSPRRPFGVLPSGGRARADNNTAPGFSADDSANDLRSGSPEGATPYEASLVAQAQDANSPSQQ